MDVSRLCVVIIGLLVTDLLCFAGLGIMFWYVV